MIKRKKLNVIDAVIVILLVLVLPAAFRYITGLSGSAFPEEGIPVILKVSAVSEDINETLSGNIRRGNTVIDAESGTFVGYIEKLEREQYLSSSEYFSDETPVPERAYLKMELRCEAVRYGDYYVIGNEKIIIGETYGLCVPGLYFNAECISVSEETQTGGFREILPKLVID